MIFNDRYDMASPDPQTYHYLSEIEFYFRLSLIHDEYHILAPIYFPIKYIGIPYIGTNILVYFIYILYVLRNFVLAYLNRVVSDMKYHLFRKYLCQGIKFLWAMNSKITSNT